MRAALEKARSHVDACSLASLALMVLCMLAAACNGMQRELAPGGAYDGDRIQYEAAKAIVEADEAFEAFLGWADRNPAYVSGSATAQGLVADVRANRDKWAKDAFAALDLYKLSRSGNDLETLQGRLGALRAVLTRVAAMTAAQTLESSRQ